MQSQANQPPRLWPIIAIATGVLLLLVNFKLIDFDTRQLWMLLLIALGIQVVRQGDLGVTRQGRTFGITRGSVEEAILEADAGALDIKLRALRKEGRLLAGQYTARSRPSLTVEHNHATVQMRRNASWLLSLADWEMGLTKDVPWCLLLSTHLGTIDADLRALEIDEARISSGIGDITLVCPDLPAGPIWARATFGDITIEIPDNMPAAVRIHTTALTRVKVGARFHEAAPGLWLSADYTDDDTNEDYIEPLSVEVVAVLGNVDIA